MTSDQRSMRCGVGSCLGHGPFVFRMCSANIEPLGVLGSVKASHEEKTPPTETSQVSETPAKAMGPI